MAERTVLVIDDDPSLRELYSVLLGVADPAITVVTAGTADDGLAAAARSAPDVVYVDQQLPGRAGLELLPELRAACPSARIVMVSGYVDADLAARATRAGADGCLEKGDLIAELAAAGGR
jgi:two-component system response regulator DesR